MKTIVSNSIREVNMSTFNNKSNLDYTDGDIAIANDIRKLGEYESNNTIKLDMVVIIMCVKGRLQVDINCNTYVIHPNDLLFCPPNIMLNDFQTSEDFEGKMIGYRNESCNACFTTAAMYGTRYSIYARIRSYIWKKRA
ncbi:hypothetical protein [Bacteroides reticulotermitis]|uniref:Uncharacterized protein n=1 Tax=Bacteroides reticulotermitis JCM 10512 TaxID=1445607 RepID=W4UYR1_9BACE|nr:hypothetical protein [Bacteroides reticulotermitis]GAE86400.1 hypothetical protein JCM10512_4911 [Bacteroides reticulotermitis JCM 10512]